MRRNTIGQGLSALLLGAGALFAGAGCQNPQPNYQGNNQNQSQGPTKGEAMTLVGIALTGLGIGTPGGEQFGQTITNAGLNTVAAEQSRSTIQQSVVVNNGQPQGQVYAPQHTTGIENIFIESDVSDSQGDRGIKIGADIKIINKKDHLINLTAYFFWGNGQKMRDLDGRFKTESGQVAFMSEIFTPPYEQTLFEKKNIFIPINQLDEIQNSGTYNLGVVIAMWDCPYGTQTDELARSQFVSFSLRK